MSAFSNGFDSTEFDADLPLYSTRKEVESIWSQLGVDLRIDDDDDTAVNECEESWLIDAIEEATDEINGYLATMYEPTALVNNRWVRRAASYLAAHILARRRGNPGAYCDEIEAIRNRFMEIKAGQFELNGLPRRDEFAPAMSNLVVDRNYRRNKLRVSRETSVGDDPPQQKQDWDFLGYGYD